MGGKYAMQGLVLHRPGHCRIASLDKWSVDKLSVDKGGVDKLSVDKLSVDKLSVDKFSVDKKSVDKGSVDKLSVDKWNVDKWSVEWFTRTSQGCFSWQVRTTTSSGKGGGEKEGSVGRMVELEETQWTAHRPTPPPAQ